MKKIIYCSLFLCFTQLSAQEYIKAAFLEKWENSKKYLLEVVENMPEEHLNFKPTEKQDTFFEQLVHIKENMDWLSNSYFNGPKIDASKAQNKAEIIAELTKSFHNVYEVVAIYDSKQFNENVDFFAGKKTKLQILNLLQDHVTHHRGQVIVYLGLNGVKPPRFVGW